MTRDGQIMECVRYAIGMFRRRLRRRVFAEDFDLLRSAAALAACRVADKGLSPLHAKRWTAIAAMDLYRAEDGPRTRLGQAEESLVLIGCGIVYDDLRPVNDDPPNWPWVILGRMRADHADVLIRAYMLEQDRADIAHDMGLTNRQLNVLLTTAKAEFKRRAAVEGFTPCSTLSATSTASS